MKLQTLFAVLMDEAQPNKSFQLSHSDIKQLASMQCPKSGDTLLHIALRKLAKYKTRPTDAKSAAQLDYCASIVQQLLENQSNVFLQNRKGETPYDLMKKCPVQWTIESDRAQLSDNANDLPKYFYNGRFPRVKVTFSQGTDFDNTVAKGVVVNHPEDALPNVVLSPRYMQPKYIFCDESLSMCDIADRNGHYQFYYEQQIAHTAIDQNRAEELPQLMSLKLADLYFGSWFADSSHTETECKMMFSAKKLLIGEILKRYQEHTADEIKDIAISLEESLKRGTNSRNVISFPETLLTNNVNEIVNPKTLVLIAKALSALCVGNTSNYEWELKGPGAKKRSYDIDELTTEQATLFNQLAAHLGMNPNFFDQHLKTEKIAEKISPNVNKQAVIGLSTDEIFPDIEILTPGADAPTTLSSYIHPNDQEAIALIFQQGASHPGQWANRDAELAKWKQIAHPDGGAKSTSCAAGCTGQLDNHIAQTAEYQKENVRQIVIMSNKTAAQLQAIQEQKGPKFLICSLTDNSREQLQELGFLSMVFEGQEYLYRHTLIIEPSRKITMTLNRSEDLPADNGKEAERTIAAIRAMKAENVLMESNDRGFSSQLVFS